MSRYVPALFVCLVFGVHLVSAQVTTGTISGVVQDPTGASVPGATVTVKNLDTGITRTVTTDERGRYTAPNLSLGNYEVQAQQSGFQTEVRSGITLTVGREAVVNMTLRVGNVAETVTVTGEAPLVESTTSALGSLVDERTVRQLPLNGRSYDQLALLQPGVAVMGANAGGSSFSYGTGRRFSVAGSRSTANSFLLDGTDINDHANSTPGGAAGTNLGVEGIREFKILTNTFTAEYGRSSGGVISAVTMSGTNQVHGSAFEFLRNSAMDARNFFDRDQVPPFRRNQFGGSLGGPIKKDKTFFFGTYEGLRQGLGTSGIGIVPTVAAKQGILPPPIGVVPVNPVVKPFLALWPDPNGRDFRDGTGEFIRSPTVPTNEDYFMIRADHQVSDKMSIFGRYSYDNDSRVNPDALNLFGVRLEGGRRYSTFQVSNTLSPTVLHSFRFAYNRSIQTQDAALISNAAQGPEFSFVPGETMGQILFGGGLFGSQVTLTSLGPTPDTPRVWTYHLFQWGDDLTVVRGRHTFKMGVDIKRIRDNTNEGQGQRGFYSFLDFQRFLEGTPSSFQALQAGQNGYRGIRESMFGVYGQDDFRLTPRLTLNLGLRWEAISDPTEVNGKMSNLLHPLDAKFTVLDRWFSVTKKNIEPRVGFAWQVTGSGTTVLRAGFGLFHDHIVPVNFNAFSPRNPPFYASLTAINPIFPNGYLALIQSGVPALDTLEPFIKEPAKYSYNFSLQQQILKDTVFEAAYVGSQSRHLQAGIDANSVVPTVVDGQPFFPAVAPRPNPNFDRNRRFQFDANASYHALQVTLRRKSSSGLQYQASYTFAKNIDEKSGISNADITGDPSTLLDSRNRRRDRGLSTFDAKQNFVVTTSYPLPFRFQQKAVRMLLGGWTINGIATFRAGAPMTALVGFNRSRDRDTVNPDRPNLIAGLSNNPTDGITAGCGPIPAGQKLGTADRFYDPCAFSLPPAGTYGNLGRNTVIGPGITNVDLSVEKSFKARESVNLQFRAELFNVLNHANFGLPTKNVFTSSGAYSGSSGRITGTLTHSREIQLGLKVIF